MRRFMLIMLLILLLLAALAACAEEESKDEGNAPKVVEDYLKAKVAHDATKLVSLACKAQEAKANQDANSFKSVKAELQDMKCTQAGKEGSAILVSCEGNIHVDYGGETRDFNLNTTQYRVIEEDGAWKWCGEKAVAAPADATEAATAEATTEQ